LSSLTVDQVRARLAPHSVTGATVVTHGFQSAADGGDALRPLADAIRNRVDSSNGTGATAWLLDYDITGEGQPGVFDTNPDQSVLPADGTSGESGHAVLLFDWAAESNEASAGWTEAAGDALFNLLAGLGLVDPTNATIAGPLHFIAHSMGAAVTSDTVERLARLGVPVEHVTYLDPHDFAQAGLASGQALVVDNLQQQAEVGLPGGYGATVWQTETEATPAGTFTDVYFQTRGLNGSAVPDFVVPGGRPIPGAFNVFLDDGAELPGSDAANPYLPIDSSGDHSYVWNCYYLGTVTGSLPTGCAAPATAVAFTANPADPATRIGYNLSRVAGGGAAVWNLGAFQPEFFDLSTASGDEPHRFSSTRLVTNDGQPNLPELAKLGFDIASPLDAQLAARRPAPAWNPLEIANGNFDGPGDENSILAQLVLPAAVADLVDTAPNNIVPGWSHHGGGGGGGHVRTLDAGAFNYYLELDAFAGADAARRSHNTLFVPPQANYLVFDLERTRAGSGETLQVTLGATPLAAAAGSGDLDLAATDLKFHSVWLPVPPAVRGTSATLEFKIVDAGSSVIDAAVRIDNVRFEAFDTAGLRQRARDELNVTGITVVTHGLQIGGTVEEDDGLMPLAAAIRDRADAANGTGQAWLVDYDLPYEAGRGYFDSHDSIVPPAPAMPPAVKANAELVLLFDWSAESNEVSTGWTESAADALFNLLVDQAGSPAGWVDLANPAARPRLHLIGHSLGAGVTSELVERLAAYGVAVDQVTYLDPHDFDQIVLPDEVHAQAGLGEPPGYGAAVWSNVGFADVYYQTRTENAAGITNLVVPAGRPIPGAFNRWISGGDELPDWTKYRDANAAGDHSYVWQCFYLGTVLGALPTGEAVDCPPPAQATNYAATGYAFGDVVGVTRPAEGNFFAADQDHQHTPAEYVLAGQPNGVGIARLGLTQAQVAAGGWPPAWSPFEITNGDFTAPGDEHSGVPDGQDALVQALSAGSSAVSDFVTIGPITGLGPLDETNIVPGWSHHGGGGGEAHVRAAVGPLTNYDLELSAAAHPSAAARTHSPVVIPAGARFLTFDVQVATPAGGERLRNPLGASDADLLDPTLVDLTMPGERFETVRVPIDPARQLQSTPLEFEIVDPAAPGSVDATVRIDNLRFECLTIGSLREMLRPDRVTVAGVTIITHGFQLLGTADEGDGMRPLADAIRTRAGASLGDDSRAWLLDYDIAAEGRRADRRRRAHRAARRRSARWRGAARREPGRLAARAVAGARPPAQSGVAAHIPARRSATGELPVD
jgi:hypothetical protein